MSRKNRYRLTTANLKTAQLTNEEYQAQRLEIAADELLANKPIAKQRKHKKLKDWPGKIPYEDYQHMQSIRQEAKTA